MAKRKREKILFNAASETHAFLSDMYPSPMLINGRIWFSVEQYISYRKLSEKDAVDKKQKALTAELRSKILGTLDSFKAKYFASKKAGGFVNPKFKQGVRIKQKALHAKFTQNPMLLYHLMKTDDALLVEDSGWDDFWGNGKDGNGENMQGKLLMQLRDSLRDVVEPDIASAFAYCTEQSVTLGEDSKK